jgi:hypothetical protein
MPFADSDGIRVHYTDTGEGEPDQEDGLGFSPTPDATPEVAQRL